jgi:hypothetical protein
VPWTVTSAAGKITAPSAGPSCLVGLAKDRFLPEGRTITVA